MLVIENNSWPWSLTEQAVRAFEGNFARENGYRFHSEERQQQNSWCLTKQAVAAVREFAAWKVI